MDHLGLVEIAGIVIVLCLIAWQFVFFEFVRPRIMRRIGRRLNVGVHESLEAWDAGVYDTEDSAPVRKTAAVAFADFAVTVLGTAGVFALVSIPLFLLAESGLPHRWEGNVTGTAARIGDITVPEMAGGRAVAAVMVRNEASDVMRACRVSVTDYRARDGYLTGTSDSFELAVGAATSVQLPLRVTTSVPGAHDFRVSLECRERLKDRASAIVTIGR
jgi:hypothetical protein